jgi:hypothetical protein
MLDATLEIKQENIILCTHIQCFIPVFARTFGKTQYLAPSEFRVLVLSCSTVANAMNVKLALVITMP